MHVSVVSFCYRVLKRAQIEQPDIYPAQKQLASKYVTSCSSALPSVIDARDYRRLVMLIIIYHLLQQLLVNCSLNVNQECLCMTRKIVQCCLSKLLRCVNGRICKEMAQHFSQSRAYDEAIRYYKEALAHSDTDGKVSAETLASHLA